MHGPPKKGECAVTGRIALFAAALIMAPSIFAAADAAEPAAAREEPAAQPQKHYPFNLADLMLVGIAKIGDDAVVTIELPMGTAAGKDGGRIRRIFHQGARIPGSGYVVKSIGADSIVIERDGTTETLPISRSGGVVVEPPKDTPEPARSRRGGRPGRMSGVDALAEFQKMTPEERKAAKERLDRAKEFLAAAKKMAESSGDVSDRRTKMMELGAATTNRISEAYNLVEKLDAARAAGDAAQTAELSQAMEAKQKELAAADAQRKAMMEALHREHGQDHGGGGGAASAP